MKNSRPLATRSSLHVDNPFSADEDSEKVRSYAANCKADATSPANP